MYDVKMTGQVPFTEMYCHSLVRDSEGGKMSKLLGNVIDALDVMGGTTLQTLIQRRLKPQRSFRRLLSQTVYRNVVSHTSSLQNFIYIGI